MCETGTLPILLDRQTAKMGSGEGSSKTLLFNPQQVNVWRIMTDALRMAGNYSTIMYQLQMDQLDFAQRP